MVPNLSPSSPPSDDKFAELESRLHYSFRNPALMEKAFTHSSFANEPRSSRPGKDTEDYEVLEFLGDTILGFVISEHLFKTFPLYSEGELSKMRAFLVSSAHLASLSEGLDLGMFLKLGHGEEKTGGRTKKTILADLFESLVAAIYLDGGWKPTRSFLLTQFQPSLEKLAQKKLNPQDKKTPLQEKLHQHGLPGPTYRVLDETGPDHKKCFVVEVSTQDQPLARASGESKKEAEHKAAARALKNLGVLRS